MVEPCSHGVHGLVDGDPRDAETVSRLFEGADRGLEKRDGKWYLYAPELDDQLAEPVAMHEEAVRLVRHMTGVARAEGRLLFGALRARGRYEGPDGRSHVVGYVEAAIEIDTALSLIDGGGDKPVPPAGPAYLDGARRTRDLDEVLDLLGAPDKLSTFDLWKVFEIVRENVGGKRPDAATTMLLATGWLSGDEYRSFKAVVHDPAVLGAEARHARHAPSSAEPMSIDRARALVGHLVQQWKNAMSEYRVHLGTDLRDPTDDELDDIVEGLAPYSGVSAAPDGRLTVTLSVSAANASHAVTHGVEALERALRAVGRDGMVVSVEAEPDATRSC